MLERDARVGSPGARVAALCAAVAATVAPAPARADGDRALSVGVGYATFSAPGTPARGQAPPSVGPDYGGSLSGMYEHGISSDLSLRGELVGAAFDGGVTAKGQSPHSISGLADVGAVFRFDFLRYVPYAFGGAGVVQSHGGPLGGHEFVLAIGGGLDFLASRERSFGIEARIASFGGDVTIVTVGVRGSVRWGFF